MSIRRYSILLSLLLIGALARPVPFSANATPEASGPRTDLPAIAIALDAYWGGIFSAAGLDYRPPRIVYEPGPLQSACRGETWFAAYCPIGEELHIDPVDVASRSERYGPALPAITLAHEWTHHLVTLLYRDDVAEPDLTPFLSNFQAEELLADCQSGVFLSTFWPDTTRPPSTDDGVREFLADNGSEIHGTPAERVAAFDLGLDGDLAACGLFSEIPFGPTKEDPS